MEKCLQDQPTFSGTGLVDPSNRPPFRGTDSTPLPPVAMTVPPVRRRGVPWSVFVGTVLLAMMLSSAATLTVAYRTGIVVWPQESYQQSGTFRIVAGQEGQVNFYAPFQYPPNVVIDAHQWSKTTLQEITTTGFRWKNTGGEDMWNNATVNWTAKGVR